MQTSLLNNYQSNNTNFGKLSIEPHAMKYMLKGVKSNVYTNSLLPSFLCRTTVSAGNHCILEANSKYVSALEQVLKTALEETQIAMKKYSDFVVTIRKGIGDAVKITLSKDIIPRGDEFCHSIILKKASEYSNPEYVSKIVEELHEMNEHQGYVPATIAKLLGVTES